MLIVPKKTLFRVLNTKNKYLETLEIRNQSLATLLPTET